MIRISIGIDDVPISEYIIDDPFICKTFTYYDIQSEMNEVNNIIQPIVREINIWIHEIGEYNETD